MVADGNNAADLARDATRAVEAARAAVEMLLGGATLEEAAAATTAGRSMLELLETTAGAMPATALRKLVRQHEALLAVGLGAAKSRAMAELNDIATGRAVPAAVSVEQLRAIDLRRRACVSLIRLNPFPTRRDSYADERGPGGGGARGQRSEVRDQQSDDDDGRRSGAGRERPVMSRRAPDDGPGDRATPADADQSERPERPADAITAGVSATPARRAAAAAEPPHDDRSTEQRDASRGDRDRARGAQKQIKPRSDAARRHPGGIAFNRPAKLRNEATASFAATSPRTSNSARASSQLDRAPPPSDF